MAKNLVSTEKRGDVKADDSVDSKILQPSDYDALEPTRARKNLGGGDRAHDKVLKNALKDAEVEETLQKAENGDGPEVGLPEKLKPDGYSDHVAKRLVEEVENEKTLKKAEGGIPYSSTPPDEGDKASSGGSQKGYGIKKLLEDTENDATEPTRESSLV